MKLIWEQTNNLFSAQLSLTADSCAAVEGLPLHCAVHVKLTDDAEIHTVNLAARGIDRATDVLSFPTVEYPDGITASDAKSLIQKEYSPDDHAYLLGDILISRDHVLSQAKEFGHSVNRELCYLLAHGIFHLFGYDHMVSCDQKEMRCMEEKALNLAGINRDDALPHQPNQQQLIALAKEAMTKSYSPYSHFKVGACLLAEDGRVFLGTNIENASYGVTNCAERSALFRAVSDGVREFSAIAIAAENAPPWPCGVCRQALNEFSPHMMVYIAWDTDKTDQAKLSDLLPHSFGPEDLP